MTSSMYRWPLFALLLCTGAVAHSAPFYRETFPSCTGATGTQAAFMTGWKALRTARPLGQPGYLKVFPPGAPELLDAFNSAPYGGQQGQAFWSKSTSGLTIFTDEYSFELSLLKNISFSHRLDSLTDAMRPVFLIGGSWYIAEQGLFQKKLKVWETKEFDPRAFTYSISSISPGVGPEVGAIKGQSLPPIGEVKAFGLFLPTVTDKVRFDNFTLHDWSSADPLPSLTDLSRCSDLPSIGTAPVSTPVPGTIDPEEPTVPAIRYSFCNRARGRGMSLSLTRAQRTLLMRSLARETVRNLRDKLLLTLLLSVRSLKTTSLSNVRVGQYYVVGGVWYLSLEGRKPLKIRGQLKRVLDRYLEVAKLQLASDGPLFRVIESNQQTTRALCTADMERMLRRRLAKVRL